MIIQSYSRRNTSFLAIGVTIGRDRCRDTPRLNSFDSLWLLQQPSCPRTTAFDRLASSQIPFEGVSMRQHTPQTADSQLLLHSSDA